MIWIGKLLRESIHFIHFVHPTWTYLILYLSYVSFIIITKITRKKKLYNLKQSHWLNAFRISVYNYTRWRTRKKKHSSDCVLSNEQLHALLLKFDEAWMFVARVFDSFRRRQLFLRFNFQWAHIRYIRNENLLQNSIENDSSQ